MSGRPCYLSTTTQMFFVTATHSKAIVLGHFKATSRVAENSHKIRFAAFVRMASYIGEL